MMSSKLEPFVVHVDQMHKYQHELSDNGTAAYSKGAIRYLMHQIFRRNRLVRN